MNIKDLHDLIKRDHSDALYSQLRDEVNTYIRGKQIAGRSVPVIVENRPDDLLISRDLIKTLFDLYLSGSVGEWDLEYILNWIELSDAEIEDDEVGELIFNFSSPEINFFISPHNIRLSLDYMDKKLMKNVYYNRMKQNKEKPLYSSVIAG